MAVVDDLADLPPFATVDRGQLETLAKHAEELDVPAGGELTHEGRHEGSVFIVVSGAIGIERGGREGVADGRSTRSVVVASSERSRRSMVDRARRPASPLRTRSSWPSRHVSSTM